MNQIYLRRQTEGQLALATLAIDHYLNGTRIARNRPVLHPMDHRNVVQPTWKYLISKSFAEWRPRRRVPVEDEQSLDRVDIWRARKAIM